MTEAHPPMSPLTLFGNAPRFYRGNLHTHSSLSDGALPPEAVCRRYAEAGYDFLCLSDHFIGAYDYPIADTRPFRTNAFTTVLGAEVHSGTTSAGELWHLLAVGLPTDFAPPDAPGFEPVAGQETAPSLAQRCRDAGAFVAIAHPQWSSLTVAEAATIEAAHAVEIYNHSCALDSDRADGAAVLDQLLSHGARLSAVATDDAHLATDDAFGGWVQVAAASLEPEAIVEALKTGAFYASQGPQVLGVDLDGDGVTVTADRMARLIAVGPGSASAVAYAESGTESAAGMTLRLPLGRLTNAPWFRVVVVDAEGRRAWLNPIWR